MQKNIKTNSAQRGFTLVELSIVLVIIGLIVGGVLVGQSLIAAAKVRAQLTQLDQTDAAMNAFRAKFDCLPGDCTTASGVTGASSAADGDGLVDYSTTWAATVESAVAWSQMATQGMVPGTYTAAATLVDTTAAGQLAAAKLGGFILIGSDSTQNYYSLASYTSTAVTTTDAISADAARTIDTKRDDGIPNSGSTIAFANGTNPFTAAAFAAASGAANCSATAGVYQVGSSTAKCSLRVRSSG